MRLYDTAAPRAQPDRREPLERACEEWILRHTYDQGVTPESRKFYAPVVEECGVRSESRMKGQPGAWFPYPSEVASCCAAHEEPVKRAFLWPMINGLLAHCATYGHIATKYGVDVKALRAAVAAEVERMGAKRTLVALGGDDA